MYDTISITATDPCGYTEYVISTYERGRPKMKRLDDARLTKDGYGGPWRIVLSATYRAIHPHTHGTAFTAGPGETGRQLIARFYNPELVANADVYAHAFSESIDH